jgi:hypothetical protein
MRAGSRLMNRDMDGDSIAPAVRACQTPHVSGSTTTNKYGFTGAGDSPGLLLDASNVVVE